MESHLDQFVVSSTNFTRLLGPDEITLSKWPIRVEGGNVIYRMFGKIFTTINRDRTWVDFEGGKVIYRMFG